MAIKNSKVKVDVPIAIINDYLLVNLDSIISLASMTHVARSDSHDLHHMDGKKKSLKPSSNLKEKVNWG